MINKRILKNPPIISAICQIKFEKKPELLKEVLQIEPSIRVSLPTRNENVNVGIDLGSTAIPIGVSKISFTSDAKVDTYVYFSNDLKTKLEVQEDTLTFIDENQYLGWDSFKNNALKYFNLFGKMLDGFQLQRASIRFINRFELSDFENPQEYFRTQISSSDELYPLPYPLRQYNFRLVMDVPDSRILASVNQNVQSILNNKYEYIFDIDVLDHMEEPFCLSKLESSLDKLREVKNEIFFRNTTDKALDLCD